MEDDLFNLYIISKCLFLNSISINLLIFAFILFVRVFFFVFCSICFITVLNFHRDSVLMELNILQLKV